MLPRISNAEWPSSHRSRCSCGAQIEGGADRFGGFEQHDAHEFMIRLVDRIHEDLNRVVDKQTVESRDWGGRPDEEVAQEAWDDHRSGLKNSNRERLKLCVRKRNDSVVVDTMTGLLKSTVQCSVCGKVVCPVATAIKLARRAGCDQV